MSLEDRIYAAGNGEEFQRAVEEFSDSEMTTEDQDTFYEKLCALGASAEEAQEYLNLLRHE